MSWHIGDYKKDTGHLRAAGHGAYFLLCMHYWATGGLPDDDEELAAIACMTDKEWKTYRPKIQKFFFDGWRHKRIDKEIATANAKYEKRALAGQKGGNATAAAKQNPSNATSNDQAKPHQPITDNHSEEAKYASSSGARKRACRLDPNWWPTTENVEYALAKGLSLDRINLEAEKFRNHWTAKSGQNATKLDWDATWKNWILRSMEGSNGRPNGRAETLVERGQRLAGQARAVEFGAGFGRRDDAVGGD